MRKIIHAKIADLAINGLLSDELADNTLLREIQTYRKELLQGSIHEDRFFLRTIYHAYNPYTGLGWNSYCGTALSVAEIYLYEALNSYRAGDKDAAYYKLGRITHLLEDMGIPAHVHCFPHGVRDDFEIYLLKKLTGKDRMSIWHMCHMSDTKEPSIPFPIIELSVQRFFYGLARTTYDISSWDEANGSFINRHDLNKRLTTRINRFRPRKAKYEYITKSWYISELSDAIGKNICDWYMQELIPTVVSNIMGFIVYFWHQIHKLEESVQNPYLISSMSIFEPLNTSRR